MKKEKELKNEQCKTCRHNKKLHAIADKHELSTTHCTAVSEKLEYCQCKKYEE